MPFRPPVVVLMVASLGCHEGEPFDLRAMPDAAVAADAPFDSAAVPDASPPSDTAAAADAPADTGTVPDSSPAPADAAPDSLPPATCMSPPSDGCPAGSARCGGPTCLSLNTSSHCGACGRSCRGAACNGGECEPAPVATDTGAPTVAANATGIFWATTTGKLLGRDFGSSTTKEVTINEAAIRSLAVDDEFAFFVSTGGTDCPSSSCLWRVSLQAGMASRTLLAGLGSLPSAPVVGRDGVYWLDHSTVYRMDKRAPAVATPGEVARNQDNRSTLATDDQYLYWASQGVLKRALLNGSGGAEPVVEGLRAPAGIAVDGSNLYWGDVETKLIQTAPKTPGGKVTTLATLTAPPTVIAADELNVYWGLPGGYGGLFKVSRCGGSVRQAAPTAGVGAIVTARGDVYWANDVEGVQRVAQ
jgi:hypothetical protein